ncbi:aldehyde dehydrogenase [Streptomyces sp. NPDC001661]
MDHRHDHLYIGGAWVRPDSGRRLAPVDPSTELPLGSVPEAVEADVDAAVHAARATFDSPGGWASWEPSSRAEVMERFAAELDARAQDIATLVSAQNGMPVSIARQLEVGYPSTVLRYYAGLARECDFSEVRTGLLGGQVEVRRLPLGVVAAIVPWNYPQVLSMFKIAPAMAAGCTIVLKPSPETPLDSYLLAEAAQAAGVPAGVLNIVPGGRAAGAHLVAHPGVDKVAFTGSTAAGRAIGETCGRLLRPVTLELGGKSAGIVLDDAALDPAAIGQDLVAATLTNNGQTCFLSTRVLAPRGRCDEVVDLVTDLARSLPVGNALDDTTLVGPLVSAAQRERVEGHVAKGLAEGARLTTGGRRPAGLERGWFLEPTVLADVDNSWTIAREEIFGPVLCVIPYEDEEDAVRIANDSDFGLGGTVWTADPDRGAALARRVHTGTIGVNGYLPDPVAPFGGTKASGLGSELGPEGLAAYLRHQSVYGAAAR